MNYLKNEVLYVYAIFIITVAMVFILTGCTPPNHSNHNNINFNTRAKQSVDQEREEEDNFMPICRPRTTCPHLWRGLGSGCHRKRLKFPYE